jgi:hypothetical protein
MGDFTSKIPAAREEWTLFVRNKHLAEENERLRKENHRLQSLNGDAAPHDRETNREGAWPDAELLIEPREDEQPYPLDALPSVISSAVTEYRAYGQQPLPLIASSALAGASLASQGLIDVARDPRLVGPISLNYSIVAVSGERKTSADRHFTRDIRKWQDEKRESLANKDGRARAAIAAWEAERDGLLAKIKQASGKKSAGNGADIETMKNALARLEQNKPAGIITPLLFYEDVNAETLAVAFAGGGHPRAFGPTRADWSLARTG